MIEIQSRNRESHGRLPFVNFMPVADLLIRRYRGPGRAESGAFGWSVSAR